MFLIILPLLLLDATASNSKFLLLYRFDIMGAPISILDALVLMGLILAVLPIPRLRMPTARVHPMLVRMFQLCAIGAIAGSFASFLSSDIDNYYYITCLR